MTLVLIVNGHTNLLRLRYVRRSNCLKTFREVAHHNTGSMHSGATYSRDTHIFHASCNYPEHIEPAILSRNLLTRARLIDGPIYSGTIPSSTFCTATSNAYRIDGFYASRGHLLVHIPFVHSEIAPEHTEPAILANTIFSHMCN